jgi:type I restriction enzyme S subunit
MSFKLSIGRTAVLGLDAFHNEAIISIQPRPGVEREYLRFYLPTIDYAAIQDRAVKGNTLNSSKIRRLPIALPPAPEQRAIARLLAGVQRAMELEDLRIAALGELKAATMAKVFRDGLRGEPLKQTEVGAIPVSWEVVALGSVQAAINYGTSVHCSVVPVGSPVLRIPNVIGGRIDETELKYAALAQGEVEKLLLGAGDLLFVRTNGNRDHTGRCAVYSGSPPVALFASYLIRVRLQPDTILPEFAQHFLESGGRSQITSRANSAADGKFNIDTGILRGLLLPKPTLAEQTVILQTIAAVEAKIDSVKQRLIRLQELFTGCLHELMTGQLRVTPLLEKEVADAD